MANTPRLNLPLIEPNMTADIVRDMNALAEAVDVSAETTVGAQAKASTALNTAKQYTDQEVSEIQTDLNAHKADTATELAKKVNKAGDSMTGPLTMGQHHIVGSDSVNHFISKVFQAGGGNTGLYYNHTSGGKYDFFYGGSVIFTIDKDGNITRLSNRNISILAGVGSPEGVVTALVGSIYLRGSTESGNVLYVKASGTGNTGWKVVATV